MNFSNWKNWLYFNHSINIIHFRCLNFSFSKIWKKKSQIFWKFKKIFSNFWKKFFLTSKMNYADTVIKIQSFFSSWKFPFSWSKMTWYFLSALNASICVKTHQNVCRMNCANVLCIKLSKKCFLFSKKGPKLTKYIWHFVVENPVFTYTVHQT